MLKSCGAVIFHKNEERKYIILKYAWGHWGFVKGKVEEGEDDMQAVLREAEEETGLKAEQLNFIPGFTEKINYFYMHEGKRIYKEVTYFLAESSSAKVKLSYEHTDYAWLPYEEAIEVITYENDRKVLEKAENFLRGTKK